MTHKADRSHKSKKERKRLSTMRKVKIVGEGRFVRRTSKPKKQGKSVRSQILRVDADFADYVRTRAEKEGSVTEVTRKIYQMLVSNELPQVIEKMETIQ